MKGLSIILVLLGLVGVFDMLRPINVPAQLKCNNAEDEYKKIVQEDKMDLYKEFIQKCPKSKFSEQASARIEELSYEEAIKSNTSSGYKWFLLVYSQSKYLEEIIKKSNAQKYSKSDADSIITEILLLVIGGPLRYVNFSSTFRRDYWHWYDRIRGKDRLTTVTLYGLEVTVNWDNEGKKSVTSLIYDRGTKIQDFDDKVMVFDSKDWWVVQ
ncbi:MAG: hypothetical protein A2Y79_14445 [Deltaproteobacteria bacterium RBG_13_43_22]|nr:MAG: hypothetical protein A2Y79_14445 [Deltaproteobacteria bacterium RBG_13_43_22]